MLKLFKLRIEEEMNFIFSKKRDYKIEAQLFFVSILVMCLLIETYSPYVKMSILYKDKILHFLIALCFSFSYYIVNYFYSRNIDFFERKLSIIQAYILYFILINLFGGVCLKYTIYLIVLIFNIINDFSISFNTEEALFLLFKLTLYIQFIQHMIFVFMRRMKKEEIQNLDAVSFRNIEKIIISNPDDNKKKKEYLKIINKTIFFLGLNKEECFEIKLDEFLYAKSEGHYIKIFYMKRNGSTSFSTSSGMIRNSIKNIIHNRELLEDNGILRIHRSYIVNVKKLKRVRTNNLGSFVYLKFDNIQLPVGQTFIKDLEEVNI